MSEIAVPRTPTLRTKSVGGPDAQSSNAKYTSPPAMSSSDLTPPPSTQVPKHTSRLTSKDAARSRDSLPSSPPLTEKPTPAAPYSLWSGPIPTVEQVKDLPEIQLRDLIGELLPALTEARMVAAHTKLQHSLLSIETAEAAERAAVEHEMTRREVEVLQTGSPILQTRPSPFPDANSPQAQVHRLLDLAMKRGRQLEVENLHLQRRLKRAKKVIKHVDGKSLQLVEDNQLLRLRIKENREHVDAMRAKGTAFPGDTPRTTQSVTPRREKTVLPQTPQVESQNAFDALLFAGQVLNGEPASVPTTPTRPRPMRFNLGHARGAQSLSSLPTTPEHPRPLTADNVTYTPLDRMIPTSLPSFSAPATKIPHPNEDRHHEDRDSTISASEDEAYTDEDLPASQASKAASHMLRRAPGPGFDPGTKTAPTIQETLIQSKLMGKVTKPGQNRGGALSDMERDARSSKRAKLGHERDRTGLGIAVWPSPS